MINDIENYERLILKIMEKVHVLKTPQLIITLNKSFKGTDGKDAFNILLGMQRRGNIILSSDGYAMTRGTYISVSGDRFCENFLTEGNFRAGNSQSLIDSMYPDAKYLIDCMWIAADLMPHSSHLMRENWPWNLMFNIFIPSDDGKCDSKLYEIIRIPKGSEEVSFEMLRALPKIEGDKIREGLIRIAVMDDEEKAQFLPNLGFRYICTPDSESEKGFKILCKRSGNEVWG